MTMSETVGDVIKDSANVDRERLKASMNRLMNIYTDISDNATKLMAHWCPYKDARARCHANFGCRNQFFKSGSSDLPVCTGSDHIDYRSAWDVEA